MLSICVCQSARFLIAFISRWHSLGFATCSCCLCSRFIIRHKGMLMTYTHVTLLLPIIISIQHLSCNPVAKFSNCRRGRHTTAFTRHFEYTWGVHVCSLLDPKWSVYCLYPEVIISVEPHHSPSLWCNPMVLSSSREMAMLAWRVRRRPEVAATRAVRHRCPTTATVRPTSTPARRR